MKYHDKMTKKEKLEFYATAPRASAKKIHKIIDGDFKPFWLAMLRGKAVTLTAGEHKLNSREEAVEHARRFRQMCRNDLESMQQGR